MAQAKLWTRYFLFRALMMGLLATLLTACRANDKPVGMTLLFQSAGMPVGVLRFDPGGRRGPVPGAVRGMSPQGGAEMSFMPGDSKRGMPTFVEVEWMVATAEYQREREVLHSRSDRYSDQWIQDSKQSNQRAPHYTRRIDLTPIITPNLVAQVRADRQNTQLKVIITFNNEDVDIKAVAYKWR
jgi:hypothetical protein